MEWVRLGGAFVALIGSIFLFLGALGIVRMPDLYNRMQAGTKSTTLGSILTLLGIGLYHWPWFWQTFILVTFLVTTNPLSSHALARAAHFKGIPLTPKSIEDKLSEDQSEEEVSTMPEAELL